MPHASAPYAGGIAVAGRLTGQNPLSQNPLGQNPVYSLRKLGDGVRFWGKVLGLGVGDMVRVLSEGFNVFYTIRCPN